MDALYQVACIGFMGGGTFVMALVAMILAMRNR